MSALTTVAATAIAATSAAAAVASFFAYVHFATRSEAHAARDEAMALAQTRGEVIADLRLRLDALERRLSEMTRAYDALAMLLCHVRADLEQRPDDVERPLARIRELLG
jgi:TolA-binding protein